MRYCIFKKCYEICGLSLQRILAIRPIRAPTTVYNLRTDAPHTFFANGIAVHNKGGGCFPPGTRIRTVAGDVPIENLLPGQTVLAVDDDGRLVQARVKTLHATRSPVLVLETESGPLRTTVEHPLRLSEGGFGMAGELGAGTSILIWQDERTQPTRILGQHLSAQEETVFNLTVDWPHTFIADGFVVHNKGGGGYHAPILTISPNAPGGAGVSGAESDFLQSIPKTRFSHDQKWSPNDFRRGSDTWTGKIETTLLHLDKRGLRTAYKRSQPRRFIHRPEAQIQSPHPQTVGPVCAGDIFPE